MTQTIDYRVAIFSEKNCWIRKTKLSFEVIVRWTKFSQFENYLAKRGKIQIYKTVKLTLDVRAIRRVTALNGGSCGSIYAYILTFIALNN